MEPKKLKNPAENKCNQAQISRRLTLGNLLTILLALLVGSSCSSVIKRPDSDSSPKPRSQSIEKPKAAQLDKKQLTKQLGLYRDKTEIGFKQITFNDCSIPRQFRKNSECSTQFLAMINFRMRCRDSEGTVEQQVTNYELTALTSDNIKWDLGSLSGTTKTDSRGFGQVIVRSWSRVDNKQFRLTANGQIMGVSAKQVRQFVLPKYWCN